MSKINSINNASSQLTIDPGASGDSYVQFSINGTPEFRIGVDDTDDSFRISNGSALGTTDTFAMSAVGERTMPLQPCFLAHRNVDLSNVTGDNTVYTIVWDSEEFDQNSDFDGTSTFTAPVTGKYHFWAQADLTAVGSSHTSTYIQFAATADTYRSYVVNPYAARYVNVSSNRIEAIIPMSASDTVTVQVMISGGTKIIDLQGNAGTGGFVVTAFSGILIC